MIGAEGRGVTSYAEYRDSAKGPEFRNHEGRKVSDLGDSDTVRTAIIEQVWSDPGDTPAAADNDEKEIEIVKAPLR